jgi:hypothetical protein
VKLLTPTPRCDVCGNVKLNEKAELRGLVLGLFGLLGSVTGYAAARRARKHRDQVKAQEWADKLNAEVPEVSDDGHIGWAAPHVVDDAPDEATG